MATLEDGKEYGLASNELLGSKRTVIHFKLTDSCLKTLEDLSKRGIQPSIQFDGNNGVIRIPGYVNSGVRQPEQTFRLTSAAIRDDSNSSFECIKQTSSHGTSSLQTKGSMQYRVNVKANDDVFDRTRANVKNAEEESKKVCTKEIEQGKFSRSRVKKVIPSSKIPPVSKPSAMSSLPPKLSQSPFLKSSPSQGARPPVSSSLHTSSSHSSSFSSRPPIPSSLNIATSSTQQRQLTATKPLNNSTKVLASSTKPTSGAINMPYRDRVIHLLALHNYKRPELICKLQQDGVREKDKNTLGAILQSVATVNKENKYILGKAGWIDVRQDWPYYTDQDRELLKRNLQERCITPTSPAVSPASSNPDSPGGSGKRHSEDLLEEQAYTIPKRKRIAHSDRRQHDVQVTKPQKPQNSPNGNRENIEGNPDVPSSKYLDIMSKYKAISSREKRSQYKEDFNRDYEEYHKLHAEVNTVASKFTKLKDQIAETVEGSPDFEALKKLVLQEYEAMKSDPKFLGKKQRMEYLHHKLGHIKRLIHDFDHRGQVLSPAS